MFTCNCNCVGDTILYNIFANLLEIEMTRQKKKKEGNTKFVLSFFPLGYYTILLAFTL